MNYFDELKDGNSQDWISYMNNKYMELNAPSVDVFIMDKERTEVDELYGESKHEAIYLPPYKMRMYHLDNTWSQVIGENTAPYDETQEAIVFVANFENMVSKHRELRERHLCDLNITYNGLKNTTIEKKEDKIIIKQNKEILKEFDLNKKEYRTIKKLSKEINKLMNIEVDFKGVNALSNRIENFRKTNMNNVILNIFIKDDTYENITDVIKQGDVILTHNMFLYQVMTNIPSGNVGWDYATFKIQAQLITLDDAAIPKEYINQIKKNQYGIQEKVKY